VRSARPIPGCPWAGTASRRYAECRGVCPDRRARVLEGCACLIVQAVAFTRLSGADDPKAVRFFGRTVNLPSSKPELSKGAEVGRPSVPRGTPGKLSARQSATDEGVMMIGGYQGTLSLMPEEPARINGSRKCLSSLRGNHGDCRDRGSVFVVANRAPCNRLSPARRARSHAMVRSAPEPHDPGANADVGRGARGDPPLAAYGAKRMFHVERRAPSGAAGCWRVAADCRSQAAVLAKSSELNPRVRPRRRAAWRRLRLCGGRPETRKDPQRATSTAPRPRTGGTAMAPPAA
jgi:hypothetical protein